MNNMLSLEEVRSFLELSQEDLEKHLKSGKLRAYKIGGTYLRFRKEDVLTLRSELRPSKNKTSPGLGARLGDFWRFNNFYIVSLILVVVLIAVIVKF